MTDWSRLAKLAGMLGSPHDGERLNAARLLQAALDKDGVSFGDLSKRIADGGRFQLPPRVVYIDREVVKRVYVNMTPNPACEIAHKILETRRPRPPSSDWKFLRYIVVTNDLTQGQFGLTPQQSDRLLALQETYLTPKPKMKMYKTAKAEPVSESLLDDMGLTEPKRSTEDYVGAFRQRAAGERVHPKAKIKPDVRSGGQAQPADYKGDFKTDPIDDWDLNDELPPF